MPKQSPSLKVRFFTVAMMSLEILLEEVLKLDGHTVFSYHVGSAYAQANLDGVDPVIEITAAVRVLEEESAYCDAAEPRPITAYN